MACLETGCGLERSIAGPLDKDHLLERINKGLSATLIRGRRGAPLLERGQWTPSAT